MRMRAIPAVLFVFLVAFLIRGAAQDPAALDSPIVPQPLPANSSQATDSSDPNDSGYASPYLLAHDWTSEDDADDAMLRTEANLQRRGGNSGFAGDLMLEAQQQRALFPQLVGAAPLAPGIPVWFSIGPTKSNHIQNGVLRTVVDSGRTRSILPHPTDPNTLYLLTSSGGLWKTTDFLMNKPHWTSKTDFVATTSGGAAVFGRDPNTIYLGLGDPFDGNAAAGAYVLKTTDGGNTWGAAVRLTLGSSSAASVRDLKIDTSGDQDIILVATNFGLFRSTNGGATFSRNSSAVFLYSTPAGTFSQAVWSIVNTSIGWVAAIESPFAGFSTDGLGKLVVSTDHGATWAPLALLQETLPANPNPVTVSAGRTTLGVGAPGDAAVYAFAARQGDGSQLDLFRSVDGGATWTPAGLPFKTPVNPNPDAANMNIMGRQAFYNHMLLVDPNDANRNTVYIGGQLSSAKTVDGGNTWRILADWLALFKMPYVHADYHAAAISPVTKSLFFGTDGGLFVSNDGGATWDDGRNEGIVSTLAYSIATSPHTPSISIIGTQDNGTFTRVPDTTFWEQTAGGDGVGTAWSRADNNFDVAFSSFPGTRVFRSTNNPPLIQAKWSFAQNGINNRTLGNFFTAYATPSAAGDPTGQAFFTYTSRQIYGTTSGGSLWTDIGHTTIPGNPNATPPIPNTPPSPGIGPTRIFRDTPHGIGVSPAADGLAHVAVVCNGGFVVVTHNGGTSWTQTGLIGSVAGWAGFNSNVEWADNNTLYVASESPSPAARVAKSTNGGASFVRSDTGLPNVPVARLLVSPLDKNTIYAATFLGVYRSTDAGATWSRFGAGLPMVEVDDLYLAPDGSFLRIATFGRGVWEIHP